MKTDAMAVMGLDIVRGSPLSRTTKPTYAIVVLRSDGSIIYETDEAPLNRVIRVAWEYHVKRMGIDNVFELAPDTYSLAKVLSLLPPDLELYQVTMQGGTFESLTRTASKLGIELSSKPRPLQTAFIAALLALHGVGTPIKAVEHRTKIIVSRARSTGSGGSSASRYARGMRTAVLRAVREIKEALDKASLSYDLIFRKGRGGLEGAVFVVYAPRSALEGVVKPFRGNDVVVTIRPEYRRIVLVDRELEQRRRYLIVGIDPGMETGIAAIDLSLRLVLLESSKELDRGSIISKIKSVGVPVMIATDKNPPPDSVKKLASVLGVPLYTPPRSLSVAEKEQLVEWLRRRTRREIAVTTTHERDALAAAVKAYRSFERKFLEVERRIQELGIDADVDELKLYIVKGKTVDEVIEIAIDRYLGMELQDEVKPQTRIVQKSIDLDSRVRALESRIEELTRERELLREEVKKLRKMVEDLEFELRHSTRLEVPQEIVRDREINELRERLKQLVARIEELETELEKSKIMSTKLLEYIKLVALGRYRIVPLLPSLSRRGLSKVQELAKNVGCVIIKSLSVDLDAIEQARDLGIAIILPSCNEDVERLLLERGVAVACNPRIVDEFEGVALVESEHVDALLSEAREKLRRFEESRKRRKELDLDTLIKIVEEYRSQLLKTVVEDERG